MKEFLLNNFLLLWIPWVISGFVLFLAMNNFITIYRKKKGLLKNNTFDENNALFLVMNPSYQILFQKELFIKQKNREVNIAREKAVKWFYITSVLFISSCALLFFLG